MSRSWLLYLDDLIASAEKIERMTAGRNFEQFVAEEAIFDLRGEAKVLRSRMDGPLMPAGPA